jgi:hypothetical protein
MRLIETSATVVLTTKNKESQMRNKVHKTVIGPKSDLLQANYDAMESAVKGGDFFEIVSAGIRVVPRNTVPRREYRRERRPFDFLNLLTKLANTGEVLRIPYRNIGMNVEYIRKTMDRVAKDENIVPHLRSQRANGLVWIWFDHTDDKS